MFKETPKLANKTENIGATTVSEINIAGVPPRHRASRLLRERFSFRAGHYGKLWSEADILGMAYDYEQATHYRKMPTLLKAAG